MPDLSPAPIVTAESSSTGSPRALWPHQQDAVEAVLNAVGRGGRTSVVAACGTGKTRIAAVVAARLGRSKRVLVVVPTIELLAQSLETYRLENREEASAVAVCSDPTIAELELIEGRAETVVTTSGEILAETAGRRGAIVLTTYASLPVIAAAHEEWGLAAWDLLVVDEAHRTAGSKDGPWKLVHRDSKIPALRRMYMTATPRVSLDQDESGSVSMDDERIFGKVSYRLGFADAIDLGLLADYRVVVPVVTDEHVQRLTNDESLAMRLGASSLQPKTVAGQIAVLRCISEFGVRRAISYHHLVEEARRWATTLSATAALMPDGPRDLWAGHVSGRQPAHLRRRVLDRLGDESEGLVVVSNARVLGEGVDVPAVDAVVFAHPRRSAIDAVQAVGRALRTGGRTDKIATVVVPVILDKDQRPEQALEDSAWREVWGVLRALRDHDERLAGRLRRARRMLGEGYDYSAVSREALIPDWMKVTGIDVPEHFAEAIAIRAVRAATPSWDEYLGASRSWLRTHPGEDLPQSLVTAEGLAVGDWWRRQRVAYNAGYLDPERIALLEAEGIVWDQLEQAWLATYNEVAALAGERGHFAFTADDVTSAGVNMLNWCSAQRTRRRAGKTPAERIELLDAIGFPWDAAADRWLRRYAELAALRERRGSLLRLPAATAEAIWLENQRVAHRDGRLAQWQVLLMAKIGIDFTDRRDAVWANTFEALKAFHAETGHWKVPESETTVDGVNLRSWSSAQRTQRKKGTISPAKVAQLTAAGFPWDVAAERWDSRLSELTEFYTTHGHLALPPGQLKSWLYQQRLRSADGRMTAIERARLDGIDTLWLDENAQMTSDRARSFYRLTDSSWQHIRTVLLAEGHGARDGAGHRALVEALLWKDATGARWEDLPAEAGSVDSVRSVYRQWVARDIWNEITRRAQIRGRAALG